MQVPEGTHLEWVGEYGELQAANHRLMIVIPLALLLIMGILYGATMSFINTLILMAQIPLACMGGVLALYRNGHAVERIGLGRIRFHLRDRDHGRHPAELLYP